MPAQEQCIHYSQARISTLSQNECHPSYFCLSLCIFISINPQTNGFMFLLHILQFQLKNSSTNQNKHVQASQAFQLLNLTTLCKYSVNIIASADKVKSMFKGLC